MEFIKAIVLGIVQGVTEFLPVSSSGHLVIFQHFFGLTEPELLLDVSLHVGTLLAIIAVYFSDIHAIIVGFFRNTSLFVRRQIDTAQYVAQKDVKWAYLIIIGSIPTAVIGFGLKEVEDILFSSLFIVGCALLVTGGLLWAIRRLNANKYDIVDMTIMQAVIIGIMQGVAVTPGISRSGATIATALFLGLNRSLAARFSFLLSLPAIAGAELIALKSCLKASSFQPLEILVGTGVSFIVGYLALKLLLRLVDKGRLHIFAPYCWTIGILLIIHGILT